MIQYTSTFMRSLRKQGSFNPAVKICKDLKLFRFRGCRGGDKLRNNNRTRPQRGPLLDHRSAEIKICLTNARSLCNKTDFLAAALQNHQPSFFGITETWLKQDIPDEAIFPGEYTVHRTDRSEKRGGGVSLLAKKNWTTHQIQCHQNHPEAINCNIIHARLPYMPRLASAILFFTVYVPPNLTKKTQNNVKEHISLTIETLRIAHPTAKILLWGDFNNTRISDAVTPMGLRSYVHLPTRQAATLDQIWADTVINNVDTSPPLGDSDHVIVKGTMTLPNTPTPISRPGRTTIRPRPQSSIEACGKHLASLDWSFINNIDCLDRKYEHFHQYMTDVNDHFFPKKSIIIRPTSKQWFTDELCTLIIQRRKAFKNADHARCKSLAKTIRCEIVKAKQAYYSNHVTQLRKTDPSRWYQKVKDLQGTSRPSSPIIEFALDVINEAFIQQGGQNSRDDLVNTPLPEQKPVESPLQLEPFEVSRMLHRIDPKKSQPLYDMSAFLLKTYHVELASPVASIFNTSLLTAAIPRGCNTLEVLPIPKVKRPSQPTHYRPIVRIPILLKVLEKFTASVLRLQISGKVDIRQFGGQRGLSSSHYLVAMLDYIHRSVHDKKFVCIKSIDIAKAYDSVIHALLLNKLELTNLHPQIFNWIRAFLRQLYQTVRPSGSLAMSLPLPITRGIPQGTSLAPTLFTIFVNDMPPNPTQWDFVDDTTQGSNGDTLNEVEQTSQSTLDDLLSWIEDNGLAVNADKSQAMLISPSCSLQPALTPALVINGKQLEFSHHMKILGLHITSDLRWETHVTYISNKAKSRLFLFNKIAAYVTKEKDDLILIYTSILRPLLEYACPAWHSALTKKGTHQIEHLQRRAVYLIAKRWTLTYEEILALLNLTTLEYRRESLTLKFARALYAHPNFQHLFPPLQGHRSGMPTRGSSNLATIRYNTERMRRSPIPSMTRLINEDNNS